MTSADYALIAVALISAVTSIVVVIRQTRKDKSDIATAISDAWGKLVTPLESRVSALEAENKRLRHENTVLWGYIDNLRGLLRKNSIDAPPLPSTEIPTEPRGNP